MTYQVIGKVTGFKGLKGEMKVKPMSAFMLERLAPDTTIYFKIHNQYQPFVVKSYHENHKVPLLVLHDYNHIEQVQPFKQKEIFVEANHELELPQNTYHQDELIGLKVYQNHIYKGEVIDIRNYPRDDYLVIKTEDKDVLIPFRDEFILSMDNDMIEIVDMEGLF